MCGEDCESQMARTIALYGPSGSGKTTQAGEYAKFIRKTAGKLTRLNSSDLGGYDSILPLVDLGIVEPNCLGEGEDPWAWINAAVGGEDLAPEIGLVVFDSAVSMGEALLVACADAVTEGRQIGTRPGQSFTVSKGLKVGSNTDSQYLVIQQFLLKMMWKSSWLTKRGIDVLWTFTPYTGEAADKSPIFGPKLVGKALTPEIPKWFKYTFRLVVIPQQDAPARHVLYLQEQPELGGMGISVGNSRYPLDAGTPLPALIEPASITEAIRLIELGQEEAKERIREELGI